MHGRNPLMPSKVDFTVRCSDPQAKDRPAKYKIAAEWTGGELTELKTFGFADDECLERVFRAAQERAAKIVCAEGEHIGEMRVFFLDPHKHDLELRRATDLEQALGGGRGVEKPTGTR
jgi:hypothetical protein